MLDAQLVEMLTNNFEALAEDTEWVKTDLADAGKPNAKSVEFLTRHLHNMYMLLAESGLINNPNDGGKSIFK
jgi:hypothetical protein